MSNNTNRRTLINQYINQMDEHNNNISQMLNIMNNQENTLRRLLFENENRNRTIFNPIFSSLNNPMNTRTNGNSIGQSRNSTNRISSLNNLLNIDNLLDGFFQNIIETPNRQQIDRAIENCLYSSIESPLNTTCPIALRRFEDSEEVSIIKFCNHIFSKNDLELWFQQNTRCPLCRYDIRNYVPSTN